MGRHRLDEEEPVRAVQGDAGEATEQLRRDPRATVKVCSGAGQNKNNFSLAVAGFVRDNALLGGMR